MLSCRGAPRVGAGVLLAAAALVTGCTGGRVAVPVVAACRAATPVASPSRPNIVFLLTDDLSSDLVRYMPHVLALEKAGTTFTNYTVTDSLCCPSRASIFTGRFPHDTGVFTNGGPDGGFQTFHERGEESATFATALQGARYRTAMMGKYLNGYGPFTRVAGSANYVPPGWSEWDVAGGGYKEFGYHLSQNGKAIFYGSHRTDYLTDVLARRAAQFITTCPADHQPFFIEVATFAPHRPYVPAPRDSRKFPGLRAPRPPSFNTLPRPTPRWLGRYPRLTAKQIRHLDWVYRQRARSVLAIDQALATIEATLARTGDLADTDIFFSSDNGFHVGEYRLFPGKMTAFDTDIRVPLVAAGPGIAADQRSAAVVENVDLAPTFEQLAGVVPPSRTDGRSLLPLLRGRNPPGWRTAALVEHHGPVNRVTAGPDAEGNLAGNPPSYEAMRTADYTYVEYTDGSRELYDLVHDPDELDNLAPRLNRPSLLLLHADLQRLVTCEGASACWVAGHVVVRPVLAPLPMQPAGSPPVRR